MKNLIILGLFAASVASSATFGADLAHFRCNQRAGHSSATTFSLARKDATTTLAITPGRAFLPLLEKVAGAITDVNKVTIIYSQKQDCGFAENFVFFCRAFGASYAELTFENKSGEQLLIKQGFVGIDSRYGTMTSLVPNSIQVMLVEVQKFVSLDFNFSFELADGTNIDQLIPLGFSQAGDPKSGSSDECAYQ